eukprot:CAMPEP_0171500330 /NCGR_PEP_ID=MMETSP0958-20121227/8930_1 /TAXON_ID=87120 /ORGANISM="Aurantiochytrium limacinum, Strain ATCCMYA-1381" /LENGTH=127 /DNA_ID=CAMNT_0012034997 /DNA_START=89 /DNA_END=472 /DNA_ORIENTATION=+
MSLFTAARSAAMAIRAPGQVRNMGGVVPKPKGQHLFGLAPGEKTNQGWESIYYWGMGICFATAAVGLAYKPNTKIQDWARDEALVREVLAEEGEEIEIGRNYSQEKYGHNWSKSEHGAKPTRGFSDE